MADRKQDDLLAAAAAGDEYAFRQIIAQHQASMSRLRDALGMTKG